MPGLLVAEMRASQPPGVTDTLDSAQRESGFDPSVVAAGQAAFQQNCTACHDAQRSLAKRKDLAGWLSTVRRMSGKEDADIRSADVVPIATYLTSLNPAAVAAGAAAESPGMALQALTSAAGVNEDQFDLSATVSLLHRSGATDVIENPGFFPEVWAGAEWRSGGPLGARVNACVSCHSETPGGGSRIELAEGFLRFDVHRWADGCEDGPFELSVDAGRFIVPFGAFAARSHPGAFRTATRPLMYNMGQNVYRRDLGPPLLPMPYADEGIRMLGSVRIGCDFTMTADWYVVNGLQGTGSVDFLRSRDYVDNNSEPAVGGRITGGNKCVRVGASLMNGRLNSDAGIGPDGEVLHYRIWGADLTARHEDLFRLHVEFSQRLNGQFDFQAGELQERLDGLLLEGEIRVWKEPRVGLVFRWDEQRRASPLPVPGSRLAGGDFTVERMTWGVNVALAGGSLLMLNHERWNVPGPLADQDVLAIRWVSAF